MKTQETHPRKVVQQVYLLREKQQSLRSIAKDVGINVNTVKRWLNNPAKYSPFYDEVALKRALQGDKSVFENLSLWEKREFWRRVRRTSEAELIYLGQGHYTNSDDTVYKVLAPQLGMNVDQFKDLVHINQKRWPDE